MFRNQNNLSIVLKQKYNKIEMFKKYEPSSYQSPQTNLNNTPGKQQHKNINELTRSYHHRRPSIQKQMSVDHDIAARRKNLHYTSGGSGCVANSGISVNNSFRSLHQRSTSSLQIYSAMKQVPHIKFVLFDILT